MNKLALSTLLVLTGGAAATLTVLHYPRVQFAVQRAVRPGALSTPHAFLKNNCAACHTPVKGVEAKNCIVCHADNGNILQRQPSAFHADITECSACHLEHQGAIPRTTKMDHEALTKIAERKIAREPVNSVGRKAGSEIVDWILSQSQNSGANPNYPHLTPAEATLNCAICHSTKDPHRQFFGNDCASCHGMSAWTIAEFRHPPATSQSCAQCHQAPPSHYMMHFKMISMTVAKQEHADVNQCFLCHQTTSWNDIKGIGFYKHH